MRAAYSRERWQALWRPVVCVCFVLLVAACQPVPRGENFDLGEHPAASSMDGAPEGTRDAGPSGDGATTMTVGPDDADVTDSFDAARDDVRDASVPSAEADAAGSTGGERARPGDIDWNVGTQARVPADEVYFYCRVQPIVIEALGCAAGGRCHARRSSLRLRSTSLDAAPLCDGDHLEEPLPAGYRENYLASRPFIRAGDAARSAFLRRALGRSHPEDVVALDSPEAAIITTWIEGSP